MIIRKISLNDLPIRVEWMNNPKIYASMHYDIPITLEKTIAWWEKNKNNENRLDVVIEENGEIIAMAGYTNIDKAIGKAETYIFANPFQLNKGIGTVVKKAICEYAFNSLDLNKLYFYVNEDNYPSIRMNEKCGFVLEGRLRQEYKTPDGVLKDRLYYGLLKIDWLNKQEM